MTSVQKISSELNTVRVSSGKNLGKFSNNFIKNNSVQKDLFVAKNPKIKKAFLGLSAAGLLLGALSGCANNEKVSSKEENPITTLNTEPPKVPDYIYLDGRASLPPLTQVVGLDTLTYKTKQDSILFNQKEQAAKEAYQQADFEGMQNYIQADKDGKEIFMQADTKGLLSYKNAETPEEKYTAKNNWKEMKSQALDEWVQMKSDAKKDWQDKKLEAAREWKSARNAAADEHCSEVKRYKL